MSTQFTGPYRLRPYDEVAVAEAMSGRRPYLSPADRGEAIRRLLARGFSPQSVADRVGCSRQTVYRAGRDRGKGPKITPVAPVTPVAAPDEERWERYREELPEIVASRFPIPAPRDAESDINERQAK